MPRMTTETSFGDWVRRRRKALDLTQEQLAELVGCSHSAIRKFETDERRPSLQIAELLATHLEISPDQRTLFLRVARGDVRVDRLPASSFGLELGLTPQTFTPPINLPVYPTPFLGREQEIATLNNLLNDPHCRLITLLGQGGMGKTRLAVEVASASQALFDGRACFIQLASLSTPDSILPAIAAQFGLTSNNNTDVRTRILGYLRDKTALLVLDNFEHLVQGAGVLTELLQQAPRVKLLVTSREKLNLQGEWTLELAGLSVPPEAIELEGGRYDALTLFEQGIKRARPDLQFTDVERAAAVRICNLVEGLPLALELAAAWVNVLSCEEIAREIEKTFDFLKTSTRDVPERHKSLRAVFEHSWKLLTEDERIAMSSLSVFRGGFSRDAAETVASASLETLSNLVAKSLIRRAENGRFDVHEVIRQYASTHLEDDKPVREKHGVYFLSMLAGVEDALKGREQFAAVRQLTEEFGNLQLAWEWGVQNESFTLMHKGLPSMWLAYDLRGWLKIGFEQTSSFIQAVRMKAATPELKLILAHALAFHGMFCFRLGDYVRAKSSLDESLSILRLMNLPKALIPALIFNGIVTSLMGEVSQARAFMDEGVSLAKQLNDVWFMALGQFNQGFQAGMLGEREDAYRLMQAGLSLWREMGNMRFTGMALNFISPIAIDLDLREEARAFLDESLRLTTAVKDQWGMGTALGRLGVLSMLEGDLIEAEAKLQQSVSIFTELGARWDIAWALTQLGKVRIHEDELESARENLLQAIQLGLETNAMPQVFEAVAELSGCLLQMGKCEDAALLAQFVLENSVSVEVVRRKAEQVRAEAEAQIPNDEREKLNQKSKDWDLEAYLKSRN
jgi:predicted ATPase/DNA-binding XRE family transcriptional regulator